MRYVFGFQINESHKLEQQDEDGERFYPWIMILAQKLGIERPSEDAPGFMDDWKVYQREVSVAVLDQNCIILQMQCGEERSYYVFTLACQFGMDNSLSINDCERIKAIMRDELTEKLRGFCRLMDIPWQQPDWIPLRGQEVRR